jgi:hypothetical protein
LGRDRRSGGAAQDLGESDLVIGQRLVNSPTLLEQPIGLLRLAEQEFLQNSAFLARDAAVALRRATHQDAIGTEHCAVGIDRKPTIFRAARIQPPHIVEHRAQPVLGSQANVL